MIYEIKLRKPRNYVHFYIVQFEIDGESVKSLWLGLPYWDPYNKIYRDNNFKSNVLAYGYFIKYFGIDLNNYSDMKDGDIREVFLNLED